jgi:ribokinase
MNKPVIVVGSYNVGLFIKGRRLPAKGETVVGDQFHEGPGGKGSNQAIAAAKLRGDVRFISCLGDDRYGDDARRLYEQLGMSREFMFTSDGIHSGISFVLIDRSGDNAIAVALGANLRLRPQHIDQARHVIAAAGVLACQLEGPLDTFAYALRTARELGVTTLLDPAPAVPLPDEVYHNTDIITPNETEAEILTGIRPETMRRAAEAGRTLLARGVRTAIIKLGERGCLCVTPQDEQYFPAVRVETVDVTGAGDAFAGGLMTALAEGKALAEAIEFATCAAALSVTKLGVVNALPTREEADRLLAQCRPAPELVACNTCQLHCTREECTQYPVDDVRRNL